MTARLYRADLIAYLPVRQGAGENGRSRCADRGLQPPFYRRLRNKKINRRKEMQNTNYIIRPEAESDHAAADCIEEG